MYNKNNTLSMKNIIPLIAVFLLTPAMIFAQAKPAAPANPAPAAKPAAPAKPAAAKADPKKAAPAVEEKKPSVPFKERFLPSIELNIPISIPLTGISDLYTLGFGALLSGALNSTIIPYTGIGFMTGFLTYSSDIDGYKSSYTAIPFVPYLEPCYKTTVGENFLMRPFAKLGLGGSYIMSASNFDHKTNTEKSVSGSSLDMTILASVGTGIGHKEFPEWLEIVISMDYMMLMETQPASMLNFNLGVKYRFYGSAGAGKK